MPDGRMIRLMVAFVLFSIPEIAIWIGFLMYLYEHGGSTAAGLIGGATLVPAIVLAPFLGVMGDRLPRGVALAVCYAVLALGYAGIALLWRTQAQVWWVSVAFACLYVIISVTRPTHYAIVPQLVETPEGLVRANSVTIFIASVGLCLGPIAAGLLLDHLNVAAIGWFCSVCLLFAALLCLRLRLPPGDAEGADSSDSVSAGLRYVLQHAPILALVLVVGIMFLVTSALDILGVDFASSVLGIGASGQGILVASTGIGGLVGSLLGVGLAGRQPLAIVLSGTLVAAGLPLVLVALTSSLLPAALLCGFCGAAIAIGSLMCDTLLQRGTDDAVMARVFAVSESAMLIGYVFGAMAIPAVISAVGVAASYVVLGVGLIVLTGFIWRLLGQIDRTALVPQELLELMRRITFLAAMRPADLERLARGATEVVIPAGVPVVSEGDVGDSFYIVSSGDAEVLVAGKGRVATMSEGDGFGEIALLHDVPRTATVVGTTDLRLVRLERDDFLAAVTGTAHGHRIATDIASARLARSHEADA